MEQWWARKGRQTKSGRMGLRGEIVVLVSVKVQFYMSKRDVISGGFGEEREARFERTFFHTRYVCSRYIFIPKSVLADSLLLRPDLTHATGRKARGGKEDSLCWSRYLITWEIQTKRSNTASSLATNHLSALLFSSISAPVWGSTYTDAVGSMTAISLTEDSGTSLGANPSIVDTISLIALGFGSGFDAGDIER